MKPVMSEKHDKRGRRLTFQPNDRMHFAKLMRQHGVRGAQRMSDVPVSINTLIRIAREFDIVFKKGKRRKAA